jgi:ubiquinone/menaquinone biosynthesis C-methylase UbiE
MDDLRCACGFSVLMKDGIYDFISQDPACKSLREEIETWDRDVSAYDTHKPRERIVSIQSYFQGLGEHRSARRMLRQLREIDLEGKTGLEVGGVGHALAMMLKSGCRELYHLEVSKESQRIAMRNLSLLDETSRTELCYLNAPAERIPLPDNSVDLLMSFGTYHHTDRRQSVPEIYRVLKPGGLFYFQEAYIGTMLLPVKWITRVLRRPLGFEPGNDNPLGRSDLRILKRYFPVNRFEIRNVLDVAAFGMRYLNRGLAHRMYKAEVDLPGVTTLAVGLLKGILVFSGQKTT